VASMPACLPQLSGEVRRTADAGRRVVELAGIGLAISQKRRVGFDPKLRPDNQNLRRGGNNRDCDKIFEDVVGQRFVQRRIGNEARIHQHDVVTVRRRTSDVVDADDAAGPRTVLDHDGLPENFAQLLRQRTAGELDDTSRRIGKDQMDRP